MYTNQKIGSILLAVKIDGMVKGGGKHVQVSYEDDEGEGEGARATGKKDTSW